MIVTMERSTHREPPRRRGLRYLTSAIDGRGEYYAALARAMVVRLVVSSLALATLGGGARVVFAMLTATGSSWASDHAVVSAPRDREPNLVALDDHLAAASSRGRAAAFATRFLPTFVSNR
jgi:hypothetical protein